MPELPEVESLRHLLTRRALGARVLDSRFPSPVILRGTTPDDFARRIRGKALADVTRRGKYLLFRLDGAERSDGQDSKKEVAAAGAHTAGTDTAGVDAGRPGAQDTNALRLVVHLRMRGGLRVEDAAHAPDKYLCGLLALDDGRELRYYDMWRWGEWWLAPPAPEATGIAGLDALGLEPFDAAFTPDYLHGALRGRRGPLKPLLLGQRVVAGLGNIYCDESLHRAGLHPSRSGDSVDAQEARRLHRAIVDVLGVAVAQGCALAQGLVEQSRNLEQLEGVYTPRVYDRPGQPCPRCGRGLEKITFHGRGTTFCPMCQPAVANA